MNRLPVCILYIFIITGCSSLNPPVKTFSGAVPATVALLPLEVDQDIQRERLQILSEATVRALKNQGYQVFDPMFFNRFCKGVRCSNHKALASRYGIEGFLRLKVKSLSRNDFLAGYYNTIDGNLSLEDIMGKELFLISHQESERGGLLFNTGQILKGFQSQIKNSGDSSFESLAERFARKIIQGFPIPSLSEADVQESLVKIKTVEAKMVRTGIYQICATGTPGMQAGIVQRQQRTNLREISAGRYCGNYRLPPGGKWSAEIRSPFGAVDREEVPLKGML